MSVVATSRSIGAAADARTENDQLVDIGKVPLQCLIEERRPGSGLILEPGYARVGIA